MRLFCEKLKEKKQSEEQRERAAHAVSLCFEMPDNRVPTSEKVVAGAGSGEVLNVARVANVQKAPSNDVANTDDSASPANEVTPKVLPSAQPSHKPPHDSYYVSEDAPRYSTCVSRRSQYTEAGYQESSASPEWDKVLENMAVEIKVRHYSRKTLKTYALWSRNFQRFLKDKPPGDLSTVDVKEYLTFLAVKCKVASSTQNQAFNALLFL